MNEYQQRELNNALKVVEDLNKFDLKWKFVPNTDEPYRGSIVLQNTHTPIQARYNEYEKKYHFFLTDKLPFCDYYTQKNIEEKMKTPQNVGVLNNNKIRGWVEYLIEVYKQKLELSNKRVEEVEAFKKEFLAMGGEFSTGYGDKWHGSIIKNGLQFTCEIGESGYISKKIEVYYSTGNSLEAFKQLSDNKYKPKNV